MTTQEPLHGGAVLAEGQDGADLPTEHGLRGDAGCADAPHDQTVEPIVIRGSAAAQKLGGAAADPWPTWAREQLLRAVAVAGQVGDSGSVARVLYRQWFNPAVGGVDLLRMRRPLVGVYRGAHAGSSVRATRDGVIVVGRHDVVGADGWWRTWGESWTPPRSRPGSIRVVFTPHPDRLADFVRTVTAGMLPCTAPWSLGCAIDPRRLRRSGAAVLDLPALDTLPTDLLDALAPTLRYVVPPLCLPLAPGVAMAEYPDNGMTFGEHRCHLIALALRRTAGRTAPLAAIADVFAAHGIDPATPYRAG